MRTYLTPKVAVGLIAALAVLSASPSAWALGTAAGTSIDNRATINYTVGGVGQTLIESSPLGNTVPGATLGADTSFLVDNRVDLTVTNQDGANIIVSPGQAAAVTQFLLTNTGNETQDYRLAPSDGGAPPYGGADNYNMVGLAAFVEDGTNVGYQVAEDLATFVDALGANGTATVYVVGDVPAGQATTDLAVVTLNAITADSLTGGLDADTTETVGGDTAGIDVVFGDAGSDGTEGAQGAYEVQTASLTITKTSSVVSDPFNLGVNPKAIPGATVEYSVTIANAGPATAANITISDDLTTEIVAGTISFDVDGYAVGFGMNVTAPNINAGAALDLTNAADGDVGDWNLTGANTVTVSGIDLAAGESATVIYRVTITYP
jgi:uncharacterized repeat protein (TIGR01451 family)